MNLATAIERLYSLNVGIIGVGSGRHERPHKPLLLLAAFDLIDSGLATPERIPWCRELRDRFTDRFLLVRKHDDQNTPDNPFHYLQSEGFWQAWKEENGQTRAVDKPLLVGDLGRAFARFTDGFPYLVAIPANRQLMREALISRYFPHLLPFQNQQSKIDIRQSIPQAADRTGTSDDADHTPEYGRSPAFRRKILEIYDHQCSACGLRIKLPVAQDISFIDAAHLIPFSESRNDHPTNGLALCKNHHWAMDRNLIAPCPDHHWHVAKILDPDAPLAKRNSSNWQENPCSSPRIRLFSRMKTG